MEASANSFATSVVVYSKEVVVYFKVYLEANSMYGCEKYFQRS